MVWEEKGRGAATIPAWANSQQEDYYCQLYDQIHYYDRDAFCCRIDINGC
jgi:hypothetical protein